MTQARTACFGGYVMMDVDDAKISACNNYFGAGKFSKIPKWVLFFWFVSMERAEKLDCVC